MRASRRIKTAIARNCHRRRRRGQEPIQDLRQEVASTTPEKAARIILDGVRKNKARVLVGTDAKMFDLVNG